MVTKAGLTVLSTHLFSLVAISVDGRPNLLCIVSVVASSVVDRGFESRLGQIKYCYVLLRC